MSLAEPEVLRVLFQARSRLSAAAWVLVRDAQTAEDIFQNVALKALTREVTFEHEAQVISWAQIATRHEALDWLRRHRARWVTLDDAVLDRLDIEWSQVPSTTGSTGRIQALEDCLRRVPAAGQRLLQLRYFQGQSCAEVADAIGLTVDAVYQRLSRLHRQLKACVETHLTRSDPDPSRTS